ncbi:hypothetical protein [Pseudoclavibacter sp. 13-3]|uniref:hypothetical protein n=1 Tax=Pseudoclavibacter sp. 13-3 TaxID=2901228 RepID=UPI001E64CAD3|nr:hypothetical protein [Pseudoclavibacter sp. 13-3]MCD7101465.1 hypothetical protein [Pseudoclavibacter sp. 13-3]
MTCQKTRKAAFVALTLTAALGFAGCASGDDAREASSTPAETSAEVPVATSSAPAAATAAETPVGKDLTTDLGEKITVVSYIDGFAPSQKFRDSHSAIADNRFVLVQVTATPSEKYYSAVPASAFSLTGASNGIDASSTTILDDEVAAAGHPIYQQADTSKGESTGWLVFNVKPDMTQLTLRYKQLAATTSDGGTIDKKNFDLPLN